MHLKPISLEVLGVIVLKGNIHAGDKLCQAVIGIRPWKCLEDKGSDHGLSPGIMERCKLTVTVSK